MLLAVAGLDEAQITERTRRLAMGDWSSFAASEQTAFTFTRKVSRSPADVTTEDVRQLQQHFGAERALDVIWWVTRSHYMTRVADAFQLPLEKENVFANR